MTGSKNILNQLTTIEVVDLFCGIGGLSYGMKCKGFNVLAGFDLDGTCKYAYETNTGGVFHYKNILDVTDCDILPLYSADSIKILAGCAPCQPFSSYAFKYKKENNGSGQEIACSNPNEKEKYDLLYEFGRLVKEVKPDIVTMENVPAIRAFKSKPVLQDFINTLQAEGFHVSVKVVYCPDYGIPQTRRRLVLLASRYGEIELIPPTHDKKNYITVRDAIASLPRLGSGEVCPTDSLHRSRKLSSLNLKRLKHTPAGGGWKDWPKELILKCHNKETGKSFGSVYGRMKWDEPAPTMTTQCTGIGNGRFGHPEQDRAISAREAALFQTFPIDYKFFENEESVGLTKASRYIGNAVPPKLGEVIAESIISHINKVF